MSERRASARFTKTISSLICLAAYLVAAGAAMATGYWMGGNHPILIAFVADAAATVVIFTFSVGLDNSSMYDPYWSVAPLPIALYWAFPAPGDSLSLRQVAVIVVVALWGARLTYNWHRQWQGLSHEDWRYADFRAKTGSWYWVVSFWGIHFFPTVQVFLGCLAVYAVMSVGSVPLGVFDAAGIVVAVAAVGIEAVADNQLRDFVKGGPPRDAVMERGLWAFSRHPNYFGEVAFWWGLWVFSLAGGFRWWALAGPLAITAMFLIVSIPMMEKRMLARRPRFAERQRRVSALVPWFIRKA